MWIRQSNFGIELRRIYDRWSQDSYSLVTEIVELKKEKSDLEVSVSSITEKHERREREIEHKLGLERMRQEQELKNGLREQAVKLKEENLSADKARFEGQMKFHEDRFKEEVGYLKEMLGQIIERLPTAHTENVNVTKKGR